MTSMRTAVQTSSMEVSGPTGFAGVCAPTCCAEGREATSLTPETASGATTLSSEDAAGIRAEQTDATKRPAVRREFAGQLGIEDKARRLIGRGGIGGAGLIGLIQDQPPTAGGSVREPRGSHVAPGVTRPGQEQRGGC